MTQEDVSGSSERSTTTRGAKVLVTPALPYANGAIHLGHLVEHIQVNVFVRALRMAGDDVLYVCGADSHGTPIELSAMKAGVSPDEYTRRCQESHEATFARFFISFDGGYGSTHTRENEAHAGRIYAALKEKGHIKRRTVDLLFDPEAKRFLPDRMVKGTCPKCRTPDQYGDSCEACGSTYTPSDLIDPRSVVSGATPITKASEHVFVDLASFTDALKAWTSREGRVPNEVQNYLGRWYADGLKDWDITRDGPYFGFAIPGETDKYFYVWLDAPIGYISLTERAAAMRGRSWEDYWRDPSTRIFHFIGKDIVYFHTLFWPAMLMAAGYTLPERVSVHGMLTVDGVKMSKSRGTFINGDAFADLLGDNGTQALRYYYACKLSGGVDDLDLSLDDFCARVNADLVNNVVNLLSRTVPMIHRFGEGKTGNIDDGVLAGIFARGLAAWAENTAGGVTTQASLDTVLRATLDAPASLDDTARAVADAACTAYRDTRFADAVRLATAIASEANKVLQDEKPWDVAKTDVARALSVLSTALSVGKTCVGLLAPIVPDVAKKTEEMLGMRAPFTFESAVAPLAPSTSLLPYPRLFERLDRAVVARLVAPADATPPKASAPAASGKRHNAKSPENKKMSAETPVTTKTDDTPGEAHISIDELMKVDLRAARVLEAKDVEGADKLISVRLDVGPLGERHVFAGLKPHVTPAELVGKTLVLVANLKPRKMKFGTSEGMLLAAGDDVPRPLSCEGARPGDKIR